jgi:hypothetical protein
MGGFSDMVRTTDEMAQLSMGSRRYQRRKRNNGSSESSQSQDFGSAGEGTASLVEEQRENGKKGQTK